VRGEGQALVVYFHPWEIDAGQPRMQGRISSRFRHYFHVRRMEGKLDRILELGNFVPLSGYLESLVGEIGAGSFGLAPPVALAR
jgi:hypothetical protein